MDEQPVPGKCIQAWSKSIPCEGLVTWGPDPFSWEVRDDDTPVWMCERHREESYRDV